MELVLAARFAGCTAAEAARAHARARPHPKLETQAQARPSGGACTGAYCVPRHSDTLLLLQTRIYTRSHSWDEQCRMSPERQSLTAVAGNSRPDTYFTSPRTRARKLYYIR